MPAYYQSPKDALLKSSAKESLFWGLHGLPENKSQQTWRFLECDQNIQIAILPLFCSNVRAKHFQFLHAITFCKQGNLLAEYFKELI